MKYPIWSKLFINILIMIEIKFNENLEEFLGKLYE